MSLEKYATGEVKIYSNEENNIGEFEFSVREMTRSLLDKVNSREDCYAKGRFPFVGFPTDQLIVLLHHAADLFHNEHNRYPNSFMDLGCGIGNTLIVAKQLGYAVSGVEINEKYLKVAQELLPNDKIEHGDLLTWLPSEQSDIVFMYKPFHNDELWIEFMHRLVNEMFPDRQIIISSLSMGTFTNRNDPNYIPELQELSPSIYQIRR